LKLPFTDAGSQGFNDFAHQSARAAGAQRQRRPRGERYADLGPTRGFP
jgi:hypothetical protein